MPRSSSTRRSDGRLVRTITDPATGKRIFFYGKTEREINQKIISYRSGSESRILFVSVSNEWWNESESRLAYSSISTYRSALRRANSFFSERRIDEIKPRDITLFLQSLANQGLAAKTVSNHRLVVNLIFENAISRGLIEVNPCSSAQTPSGLKKGQRTSASSSDEKSIIENPDVWLFPYIAIMTGMRRGEILALQWRDVDFEQNTISVTKSVFFKCDRPNIKKPKTEAGVRTVPLLAPLKTEFEKIKDRNPSDFIISDTGSDPLTYRRFCTLSKHYKEKTGVTCTAHQLRHSFATIAFECEVPVKSVQEILGHKQLSTTMDIYTDFRKQSLDAASAKLNDFMLKK